MKRAVVLLAGTALVLAAVAGGWWLLQRNEQWRQALAERWKSAQDLVGIGAGAEPEDLVASGFIEAQEMLVTSAQGGRIVALHADEGDEVRRGQVLAELDRAMLLSQIESARADLEMAEANLALVEAGARRETMDHARAQLEQARVAAEAARVSWQDAQAMADNPQDLELALLAAQAQVEVLGHQTRQAQAAAAAAQAGQDLADSMVSLLEDAEGRMEWVPFQSFPLSEVPPGIPVPEGATSGTFYFGEYKGEIKDGMVTLYIQVPISIPADKETEARRQQATSTYQAWTAWTGAEQAEAAFGGAEAYAGLLALHAADPLSLQARANAAQARHQVALAAVGVAEAQVAGLNLGATAEQIAAAEAQVEVARAALKALEVQLDQLGLSAPVSGLVLERPVQSGELALPGAPLFALANLDRLTLTVYVPEDQVGRVILSSEVTVTVDAFPDRTFDGRVIYMSGEAEFTPKNVQTREERVNLVFAVKIELPNPGHLLKPGMPADARLLPAREHGIGRDG